MKSISEYKWHGHDIKVEASASPKFLWLDYTLDVHVDDKTVKQLNKRTFTCSKTNFSLKHNGHKLKGEVISSGFPCTPVISQSTIVDDTILGKSQILVKKRIYTYAFLSAVAYSLKVLT